MRYILLFLQKIDLIAENAFGQLNVNLTQIEIKYKTRPSGAARKQTHALVEPEVQHIKREELADNIRETEAADDSSGTEQNNHPTDSSSGNDVQDQSWKNESQDSPGRVKIGANKVYSNTFDGEDNGDANHSQSECIGENNQPIANARV